LPQIFNVLRGDMSFVGPRPGLPVQAELTEERRRRGVFALRPGITGLAQVRGIDMSDPARLAAVDADYAASRSLAGDLRLIWRTFAGSGRGDAAAPPQA
jgi:lipopolysaccharide/colanic/teichoic acid biosynthesis glycosyltransferase